VQDELPAKHAKHAKSGRGKILFAWFAYLAGDKTADPFCWDEPMSKGGSECRMNCPPNTPNTLKVEERKFLSRGSRI
jgi:hypothetical protein